MRLQFLKWTGNSSPTHTIMLMKKQAELSLPLVDQTQSCLASEANPREVVKKAFGIVKPLEPVERWVIFRSNQGTDAHLNAG